ncbi:MAG: hypothetical protein AAFN79_22040, partial [Pseudomonadota bacterium]
TLADHTRLLQRNQPIGDIITRSPSHVREISGNRPRKSTSERVAVRRDAAKSNFDLSGMRTKLPLAGTIVISRTSSARRSTLAVDHALIPKAAIEAR